MAKMSNRFLDYSLASWKLNYVTFHKNFSTKFTFSFLTFLSLFFALSLFLCVKSFKAYITYFYILLRHFVEVSSLKYTTKFAYY